MVRQSGRSQLSMSDAILLGGLILHPELGTERVELLAECGFHASDLTRLAADLGMFLADNPDIDSAILVGRLERAGHGPTVTRVLEKLRGSGLAAFEPGADAERAALIWDDAAHLRLRAGTLSIERQAAASALGRDTSDFHLVRLRDIQEQDQRSLRPDRQEGSEAALIVHPFKGR
jgi:hypothetical protein